LADRYAVEREIGAGGMATVYLASDLRHDRKVALKVLNHDLGAVLGVERFLSEIRVTASLQHPNLLPLFDSGSADGLLFYVTPFIEGESLRHKLQREKQLSVDEAIRIGSAVANALDYAHAHGVIHRDLKPENILLQHGQPFVADFGIALAISNAGAGRLTQSGLSLGTPQYMSPEQASGERSIDARTDIYSLGAVDYEMLTGEPPHTGVAVQAIVAKLMTEDVRPIGVLRRAVPSYVDVAVRRALEKLPADRFATAKAFGEALTSPPTLGVGEPARHAAGINRRPERTSVVRSVLPWAVALAGVGIAAWSLMSRDGTSARVLQLSLPIEAPLTFESARSLIAATADGSRIGFTASRGGRMEAFVRSLNDETATPLPGAEDAAMLFASPDGKSVGLLSTNGDIKTLPLTGGAVRSIARSSSLSSPARSTNDLIVFSQGYGTGLFGVAATGGSSRPITRLRKEELGHGMPAFLPDGQAIVFTIFSGHGAELAVTTLGGEITRLGIDSAANPIFVQPDVLLYVHQNGDVQAIRFDAKRRRTIGRAVTVLQNVAMRGQQPMLTVSADGSLLAYIKELPRAQLALIDSLGVLQVIPADPGRYGTLRVSPNGEQIAVDLTSEDGAQDIWIQDLKTGVPNKLTSDGHSLGPVWSRDGKRISFTRQESETRGLSIYAISADGSDKPRALVAGPGARISGGFAPDDKTLVYQELVEGQPMHVSAIAPGGKPRPVAEAPNATVGQPAVSPDGRWLAYVSNATKRDEVFVGPLSGGPGKQVSTVGGTSPAWSRDGKTLYFRENGYIIAAALEPTPSSSDTKGTITVGRRRQFASGYAGVQNIRAFDPMPDGKHLAVLVLTDESARVSVVVNWMERVKELMEKN
jgi:serine/threonine-protein kinase